MEETKESQLQSIYLRFINIKDDKKLIEILSKILNNLLIVYTDKDLLNADLLNPKIKALEEIMSHLIIRMKNSIDVIPPYANLINIFISERYQQFENSLLKKRVADLIMIFIFESFQRIKSEQQQSLLEILFLCIDNEGVSFQDKTRLFLLLIQLMVPYSKSGELNKLCLLVKPIFPKELKNSFLQFSLYFVLSFMASIQQSLMIGFQQALGEMSQKFKKDFKESQTQFNQQYEEAIMKFIAMPDIFQAEETFPFFLIASLSNISKTKEYAEISLRSILSNIDTKNTDTSKIIYRLIFNETYIYKDFPQREDQDINQLSLQQQIKLFEHLMRFECCFTQHPLNLKFVFHCFFSIRNPELVNAGLKFLSQMIRYDDLTKESTLQFLKQTIVKIQSDDQFSDYSKAMCYQLLSDMSLKNYQVLNDDIELVIEAFQKLRQIVQTLKLEQNLVSEEEVYIRKDEIAICYIESLNKFRDSYEKSMKDSNKRNVLLNYIVNYLNKEGKSNPEIVYLLFLYLSRLDKGTFQSSVLLYAILFKDHSDIKIKREAQMTLEKFEKNKDQNKRILVHFLKDISMFLQRNGLNFIGIESMQQFQNYLKFDNSIKINLEFINKIYEITFFVIRFFKEEQQYLDQNSIAEVKVQIEFLLLLNLNQNFRMLKSDFSQQLELIYQYLKLSKASQLLFHIGSQFVYELSSGTSNLSQRVLSLKVQIKLLQNSNEEQNNLYNLLQDLCQGLPKGSEQLKNQSPESKLNIIYKLTLLYIFGDQEMYNDLLCNIIKLTIDNVNMSPNIMEQLKLLSVGLKKIGSNFFKIKKCQIPDDILNQVIQFIVKLIKRKDLEQNFRKYLIRNLSGILKLVTSEMSQTIVIDIFNDLHEYENNEIQDELGSMFAKVYFQCDQEMFTQYIDKQVNTIIGKGDLQSTKLPVKRNSTIYLFQIVKLYGKTQKCVQQRFLTLQKVFLKFLFDRKPYMQDISSRCLSLIYELGTEEVRVQLVDSLSLTLSGEKSASEHQEKDENQELLLEFKDNTSNEQKEKLKTYKDLCNIAVELGHRELIYQFLEVHRHLAHYQDIKNAAKGLSGIIMMDERLKKDLIKIAPKIYLMTYDHNQEVSETMKELWNTLIDIQDEEEIIQSKWPELLQEAYEGLISKEYRKRQSSALALSDLLQKRTWPQIKSKFRELFLISLGLLDDQKDTVKMAAFQLAKSMKRITLKLGNIYTNSDVEQLEEILSIVIPMILDDCMKSTMQVVKFFSVDLLFDIIKTSQSSSVLSKIQSKTERQLVFNYNSELKMKEILNKFLDRIILEVIGNMSQMNKAIETINKFEQMAIDYGMVAKKAKSKVGISEGEFNEMRMKYTKESTWGEILKICRDQMTDKTFDKILNDLISFMRTAHDITTKSTAVSFVSDIILENKLYLITPQNSRRITQKLVEIYSLSSQQEQTSVKESLQLIYAQCLGLQMKILKAYPKTVQQVIDSLTDLPKQLESVILLNIYEICKNLSEDMIKSDNGLILRNAVPMFYVNRFSLCDIKLKALSRKIHQHICEIVPHIVENNVDVIFKYIKYLLDSNSYDDRVAASMAITELAGKLSEEDIQQSQIVLEVIDKLHLLIQAKYFNNKESVVEGLIAMFNILEKTLINNQEFVNNYVMTCIKQIEKFSDKNPLVYKNWIIKSFNVCLQKSDVIYDQNIEKGFDVLILQLKDVLQSITLKASLIENVDEFEEKKEDEKQTIQTALEILQGIPYMIVSQESRAQQICGISIQYYINTNWIIRNAILKAIINTIKDITCVNKMEIDQSNQQQEFLKPFVKLVLFIIENVSNVGEKYDMNLVLVSELILLISERQNLLSFVIEFNKIKSLKENSEKIVLILIERGSEQLIKNVDMIKNQLSKIMN